MSTSRNHSLDGIRGLAALAVALGHCNTAVTGLGAWSPTVFDFPHMDIGTIAARLWHVLFPADAAVMIFFVLSGYVLGKSLARTPRSLVAALQYVVRRALRLYPVSLVANGTIGLVLGVSMAATISTMLLIGWEANGVTWSLHIELFGSALVLLMWLAGMRATGSLLLAAGIWAVSMAFPANIYFLYLPAFALGFAVVFMAPSAKSVWLPIVALMMVIFADLLLGKGANSRYVEIVGATFLVSSVAANPRTLLEGPAVQFLGRVSYPFYLVHPLALVFTERLVPPFDGGLLRVVALALASVPIALVIAAFLHRAIETPGIHLGSRLASWIGRLSAARRRETAHSDPVVAPAQLDVRS